MESISVRIQKYLLMADKKWHVEEYLSVSSIILAVIVAVTYFLFHPRPSALAIVLLTGVAVILYLPKRMAEIRSQRAEAEMPYVLRTVAAEVEAGIPFVQALKDGAKAGKTLGKAIEQAISLYRNGIPMERALKAVGESFLSEKVKRVFLHLGILYQNGREAVTIKKMADDMISVHRAEAKRFSSELAVYTLFFIAISALVPALFEMYVMLGSLVMKITLTPKQVFFLSAAVFPTMSALSLLYVYLRAPASVRR